VTRADIEPYSIEVPGVVLDDLRDRLGRTRWPDPAPGDPWNGGVHQPYLRDLCDYWARDYDWSRAQAELNSWDQFVTSCDGQRVHFLHVRSAEADALPLVMTHGWPGSVAEFVRVLGPLTDPVAHGGSAADAFHVVCPSLPGYGFSGPTSSTGWNPARIAAATCEIMARLGYERYGAQGGDWGSAVSSAMAALDPEHVVGIHLNLVNAPRPADDDPESLDDFEREGLRRNQEFVATGSAYLEVQRTTPQTLGYALTDSPAGLAAWIVDKFRLWSDCDGDVERSFSRDWLLTNVMIYWVTGTIVSSARLYQEAFGKVDWTRPGPTGRNDVPMAGAIFPKDTIRVPRRWAERAYNVRRWTAMPRGGHFAAMEEPELLVDDVRAFFRELR
jgi:epoxide hydrolase